MDAFELTGRTALVTGAGGSLGRVFSVALAEAGARVITADMDEDGTHTTAALIRESNRGPELQVDVSDSASVEKMAESVASDGAGTLDILVNCAGVSEPSARVHEVSLDEWNRVIGINLTGTFLCSRALIPLMLPVGKGSIINLSSVVGVRALNPRVNSLPTYAASKAGVVGLTMQMAADYGADGIRVNAIAPGWHTGSNLGKRVGRTDPKAAALRAAVIERDTPLHRLGAPEEMAGLIVYLASDASSFVTGQVIAHDGGVMAW